VLGRFCEAMFAPPVHTFRGVGFLEPLGKGLEPLPFPRLVQDCCQGRHPGLILSFHVSTMVQKKADCLGIAFESCLMQGGIAFKAVLGIHVSTVA